MLNRFQNCNFSHKYSKCHQWLGRPGIRKWYIVGYSLYGLIIVLNYGITQWFISNTCVLWLVFRLYFPSFQVIMLGRFPKVVFVSMQLSATFSMLMLGVERTPDPDTSGNRYAKPDPSYPTRLSAKVLISRIANYSTLIVPFTVWMQGLLGEKFLKSTAQSISWLTTGVFPQTSLKILSFVNLHRVNLTRTWSWFQHLYPISDPTRIFSARSTPI